MENGFLQIFVFYKRKKQLQENKLIIQSVDNNVGGQLQ